MGTLAENLTLARRSPPRSGKRQDRRVPRAAFERTVADTLTTYGHADGFAKPDRRPVIGNGFSVDMRQLQLDEAELQDRECSGLRCTGAVPLPANLTPYRGGSWRLYANAARTHQLSRL